MTNPITPYDDLIDSRDVEERIEELQETATTDQWLAGWNLPGYLPDNTPMAFDNFDDAVEALIESALDYADEDEDATGPRDRIVADIRLSAEGAETPVNGLREFCLPIGQYVFWVSDQGNQLDADDQDELNALLTLKEDAEGESSDWPYGETLIRDSYFREYAQETAEECGMIPEGLRWPVSCIDWDQAARELQMDYTQVDFAGTPYWIRSC